MKIIGCDFHPSFQQIAMVDTETGEQTEKKLTPGEAVQFYSQLPGPVLVGMEACGNTLWFERLLAKLGHELWLGDAGKIRALEVRKQKTDRRDAELLGIGIHASAGLASTDRTEDRNAGEQAALWNGKPIRLLGGHGLSRVMHFSEH
jgi:hypothetical protein